MLITAFLSFLFSVCGEEIIYNQRNTMDQVKYLQGIYNNTLEHVLITKVNRIELHLKTCLMRQCVMYMRFTRNHKNIMLETTKIL